MLSLNRIDNSIEFYGEKIATLADNHNAIPLLNDIIEAWEDACTFEDRLNEAESKGRDEASKQGWIDGIDKVEHDLENYLDSILDHSEHDLSESFKDELYKGIADIIRNAKDLA